MDILSIKTFLRSNPGYLKKSAVRLSERLNAELELCETALYEARREAKEVKDDNANNNESVISEFQEFLDKNEIKPEDVASVKFWQTMSGKQRFSVVTKGETKSIRDIKKEIEEFASIYSSKKVSTNYKPVTDPVAYEISLPDIHYGKLAGISIATMELQFLSVVEELVEKAKGLNIERFVLPIGNDGMNSEGMRMSTTKGTPQQDNCGWKDTFTGYWRLMVAAIDYLKTIAPVDVIVISGNHDFERMFYAGDVISGWFRNDLDVTVDNNYDSRKYYEYGWYGRIPK